LVKQKQAIEAEFGEPLIWEPQTPRAWNWIGKKFEGRGLRNRDAWPSLHDEMIDAMVRLDKALRPRLARIEV
jgi:hypothetical protein